MKVLPFVITVLACALFSAVEIMLCLRKGQKKESIVYSCLIAASLGVSGMLYLWPNMPDLYEISQRLFPWA